LAASTSTPLPGRSTRTASGTLKPSGLVERGGYRGPDGIRQYVADN
jgi:hypothetical protein